MTWALRPFSALKQKPFESVVAPPIVLRIALELHGLHFRSSFERSEDISQRAGIVNTIYEITRFRVSRLNQKR
jgi:hypothetical protein